MRRLCLPLLAAVVLGCVAAPSASVGQGAGCGDAVQYRGTTYSNPVTVAKPLAVGQPIATTFGPHCVNAGEPDTTVRAIAGMSPRLALLRAGQPRRVYLAPSFFPETRGHPLHARLYPRGGPKPTCRTGKVVTWRYPIGSTGLGRRANVSFLAPSGSIGADVYEDTKITSAVRVAGQPYVAGQYPATAVVRKCKSGRPLVLKLSVRPPA